MAQMNMIEAIRSALDIVMDKDPNVVVRRSPRAASSAPQSAWA